MANFDLVLFGASGFTGRLVAEYLAARDHSLRWGLAGRDLDRLAAVREEIGTPDLPLLWADVGDPASLRALVLSTRAVISTVGPYQIHGSGLVAACAAAGTDYLDLCGEPAWMGRMIDAHEATAQLTGARILFSCGFDSLPFELGVRRLQAEAIARLGRSFPSVKSRVRILRGGLSGGTSASLKASFAAGPDGGPFTLTPGFDGPPQPPAHEPRPDDDLAAWAAPFLMTPINAPNVHRANLLSGHVWGKGFLYDEALLVPDEATARSLVGRAEALATSDGPRPGDGPSRAEREAGAFDILFMGRLDDGRSLRLAVTGDRDPGYGATSRMIAETALCLRRVGVAGGIWTPGAALGDVLIDQLIARAGLRFEMEG